MSAIIVLIAIVLVLPATAVVVEGRKKCYGYQLKELRNVYYHLDGQEEITLAEERVLKHALSDADAFVASVSALAFPYYRKEIARVSRNIRSNSFTLKY